MTAHGGRNRPAGVDETIVAHLAAGATYGEAAVRAGCSKRTVERRMTDPAFRDRVAEARRDALAQTAARLAAVATAAVDALAHLMLSADADAARVSAARAILTLALPWRGAVEVETQLAELRQQVAEINAGSNVRRLK